MVVVHILRERATAVSQRLAAEEGALVAAELVAVEAQDAEVRQDAQRTHIGKRIAVQIELLQRMEGVGGENGAKVAQAHAHDVELAQPLERARAQLLLQQVEGQPARVLRPGRFRLDRVDPDSIEHLELIQVVHHVMSIVWLATERVVAEVKDDELGQ